MDTSTFTSVSTLYQGAGYPVLLFNADRRVVWKNELASSCLFDYTDGDLFRKTVFTPENENDLLRCGTAYVRPGAAFADLTGMMLTQSQDGVLAVLDNSQMGSSESRRFNAGGFDSFTSLVRSNLDRLTLSAASAEYAVDSDDPEVEQLFDNIRRSSYEILRGLNNASLVSKYISGTLSTEKRSCDIGELVQALCVSVQSVLSTRIRIDLTVRNGPVIANVDVKLCERALLNLFANSIRYTRDGNHIDVTVGESANGVNIVVRDRGAGIQEENVALVTKPYFSVEPASDGGPAPGLGLGLPVASVFCETHGGTLILNSRFGEGTTVALSFESDVRDASCFHAAVSTYVTDRFSPLYVELCGLCEIPK